MSDRPRTPVTLPHADEPWANHLSHLMWEAAARMTLLAEAALAEVGLSPSAVGLLDQIASTPGITIAEIARRTPKTQQAISQMVARLEKLGYVERRLAGGRAIGLHVTATGAQARERGNAAERRFEDELRDALGPARADELHVLLHDARAVLADLQARRGDDA